MIFTSQDVRQKAFLAFSFIMLLLLFSLPTPSSALRTLTTSNAAYPVPPAINASWKLTFDDEFNGTGVDWTKWQDGGKNWGSGGNGEKQAYLPEKCSVAHGLLQIQADSTPGQKKPYSSCMLNTMQTFQQTYGYFAFRGKLTRGQGFWPAFWLYESATGGKPEIDVMENLGNDTTTYYMTYHIEAGTLQQAYHGIDLAAAFHTYAVKWMPDSITFYLDNMPQFVVTDDIYTRPMFILIDMAVGGNWPGSPDASTRFPGLFDVDYVRAYAMP